MSEGLSYHCDLHYFTNIVISPLVVFDIYDEK